MKNKLLIIAMLLFSAMGFSQFRLEVIQGDFFIIDTAGGTISESSHGAHEVEYSYKGGKIYFYDDNKRIGRSSGYLITELQDPAGNAFADYAAFKAWMTLNTNFKSGGGSTTGQTAAQVQAAITASQNTQNTEIATTYETKADALLKVPNSGTPLQLLRVNAAGTENEWFTQAPSAILGASDVSATGILNDEFLVYNTVAGNFQRKRYILPMAYIDTQVGYDNLSNDEKNSADWVIGDSGSLGNGGDVGTDDQISSEVSVIPAVNSLVTVQDVLENHESRIDDKVFDQLQTTLDKYSKVLTLTLADGNSAAIDLNPLFEVNNNAEFLVQYQSLAFPPDEASGTYFEPGYDPIGNVILTSLGETSNGEGSFVLQLSQDGTYRMFIDGDNATEYEIVIRYRLVTGSADLISLAGTTPALNTPLTSINWVTTGQTFTSDADSIVLGIRTNTAATTIQLKMSVKEL